MLLIGSRKERHVHGIVMVEVYSESIPKPVSGAKGAAAHLSDGFVNGYLAFPFGGNFVRARRGGLVLSFGVLIHRFCLLVGLTWPARLSISAAVLQHEAIYAMPAPSLQRSEQDPEAAGLQKRVYTCQIIL